MKSFRIALQLKDCARVVQSWTRLAFPIAIKGNVMKSFRIALQLQDCARVVQSWTRLAFPIENVRNIINPSSIDQSRLQCDYKRMSNPATIHWIGSQILGTCFCFNPDRIVPII